MTECCHSLEAQDLRGGLCNAGQNDAWPSWGLSFMAEWPFDSPVQLPRLDPDAQWRPRASGSFSYLLRPIHNFKLTSSFGIILEALLESSFTYFLQLGSRVDCRPLLTSFKFNPPALFPVEFLTSVLRVSVPVLSLQTRCRLPPDASLRLFFGGKGDSFR